MNPEEMLYVRTTEKSFQEAVVAVMHSLEQHKWALFQVYDIAERLAAKGFLQKPLKILEFCSASHAHQLLQQNRLLAVCMPCRIAVLQEEKVTIAAFRPVFLGTFFPELDRESLESMEAGMRAVIDASCP